MAWVDLQVNGYAGVDFNSAGLTVAAVKTVVDRLAAAGVARLLNALEGAACYRGRFSSYSIPRRTRSCRC